MGSQIQHWVFVALLVAVFIPTVKLTGLTEQVCTPTPGDEDVVKTDDPYSSDQDGCACTDPSIEETCHCLVGYGGTGAVCSRECSNNDTNCVIAGTSSTCTTSSEPTGCECAANFTRAPDKDYSDGTACVAVPDTHCDPSVDPGPDRKCVCLTQTNPPDTPGSSGLITLPLLAAYLDPKTCYCIGGYTQDPADTRNCTNICTNEAGSVNCLKSLTSTEDCASGDVGCRCRPGYAPVINTTNSEVDCADVYCIPGEGNSVQQSYCKMEPGQYDPSDTKCASGTGPKKGTSYCSTDCLDNDPNCLNSDQTGDCTEDDDGCQCKQGYGLTAPSADEADVICTKVYCTKEDSNCVCASETADIDDCWCSYGTTADPDILGWCTSACKPGQSDCVRGDTGERCYAEYVGSTGCHCRMKANSFFVPFSSDQAAGYGSPPGTVECVDDADCYYTGPSSNCICTTDGDAKSCSCDRDNGFVPDSNNPGLCVAAFCSITGEFPEAAATPNYTCKAHACEPGDAAGDNLRCVEETGLTAPISLPYSGHRECLTSNSKTSSDCVCDFGFYSNATGHCLEIGAEYCDPRHTTECTECPSGTNSLTQCTCGLGYYIDERDDNARECLRFCSPDQGVNCVATGTTTECVTPTHDYGQCVCAKKYMPQKDGSDYKCVEVTCDFLLEGNCDEGTYIASTTYDNVHCAEGFVPDPVAANFGECTGGCTDTTDANCMEGGSVTSPGSTQCETTPCFCRLGYNPVYDAANNKITCSATECNPLVDVISAQCKCQYTTGAVSFDMTSCKCAGQYAPSQPNDGTCTNECASEQANCKVSDNSVEECGGGGCVCRAGYTSVYNTASQVYQCEPYECDSSVAGCVCSNPGDVSSCTCTGTTTVGSATITYVGNKYAFPGYCRPVECNPSSDSNCACVDSSLLDTCYCKPGYAIDYQYDQILIDATTNSLDVSTYFSTSCKLINFRSSCPIPATVPSIATSSAETGCACTWSDKVDNQYLCFCGLVIDEDCFISSCQDAVDNFAIGNDGPCSMDIETIDSVTYSYSMCRDGMLSDMAGACTMECDWTMNSPNLCKETAETCNTGYVGHLDLFGNKNCYVVECEKGSTNCICEAAITKLHNWDNRLCRCGPGYAADGNGGCTDACSTGSSHCNRVCSPGSADKCCDFGYTPRATWTADTTSSSGYTATVNCVSAGCNIAVDSSNCVCATDAYDEGSDMNQCACKSGTVHTGKGGCEAPTVATCISCSGTGESSACYETEIQASQIDATAGTVTVGAGNVFSLETCKLDSNYNQNYKSCEVRSVKTDGGAAVVTRGCSSDDCNSSNNNNNDTLICATSSNVQTCVKCCKTAANCNIFSAKQSSSVALDNVAIKGYFIVCILLILY